MIFFQIFSLADLSTNIALETSVIKKDSSGEDEYDSDLEIEENFSIVSNQMNFCRFKNLMLLNEESKGSNFKICNEAGEVVDLIRKSAFLWTVQEESERVSSDRLRRFHYKHRQDKVGIILESSQSIFVSNGLKRGHFVILKSEREFLVCGQIIKFQYSNAVSKSKKRYTFDEVFFGINENVEILLSPCYNISQNSNEFQDVLKEKFLPTEQYCFHLKPDLIDFSNLKFKSDEIYKTVLEKCRES